MAGQILNLDEIVGNVDAEAVVEAVLKDGSFNPTREVGSALPYTHRVGLNDLIPEEYQQRLMALDLTLSNAYFELGDIANELINSINRTKSAELGKIVSKTDIYEAIGVFVHRSARSIRYYWEVSHWFPLEVRQKFDVPFNIYAVARWIDNWELVLMIAAENPMWSAEHVRAEYYKQTGIEPPVRPKKDDDANEHVGGVEVDEDDLLGEQSEPSGGFKAVLLSRLEHSTDMLREVLDRIPLPTSVRVKIGEILLEIQDVSLEIRREA